MSHKKCRATDGLKYVTRRLQDNPKLIQTISDCPTKGKRRKAKTIKESNKLKELNRQLKVLDKLLKSDKQTKTKETAPQVYSYPVIDRRI